MDAIEVDVSTLVAVPLRHRLFASLSLRDLQAEARARGLGGPISRALKHDLAARVADAILASRVEEAL